MNAAALLGAFGRLSLALAAAQTPPLALALADSDAECARGFVFGAGCALFVGVVLAQLGRGAGRPGRREALVFAVAGWGVAGLLAALPFFLSGAVADFSGSLLEAVSGVTTSGIGVIGSPDSAPRAIVLWRALLQWSGGYATLVFVAAAAPQFAFAAQDARAGGAFRPRLGRAAGSAAIVYLSLTGATGAALVFAGAPLFHAACYAMSSVSTGGFSANDGGPAAFGRGVQAVLMLAMAAGALNLLDAWRAGAGRAALLAGDVESRLFVTVLFVGAVGIAAVLGAASLPPDEAIWRGAFAAVSALTTTGFEAGLSSPVSASVVLALAGLALVGGAGGSTSGGVKLARALRLLRQSRRELERLAHPHRVVSLATGGASGGDDAVRGVWAFFTMFILFLVALTLVLAAHGLDFPAASVLALSALTNSGPLLAEAAGAAPVLTSLPWSGDIALALGMVIGRLEMFAFFVVLTPLFWRR